MKNYKSKLLKIYKKHYKGIKVYYIGYITIKIFHECENIYGVNPLCLLINYAYGYLEEKTENKFLILDSTDENKKLLKRSIQMFGME